MIIKSISYYYPPLNSSEGYSEYKVYSHSKYKIEVYSQKNLFGWTYSNDNFLPKNTIYIEAESLNSWMHSLKTETDWSKVDVLITRSTPNKAHSFGLFLKKKYKNIKWIAFFSDPISYSPLVKYQTEEKLISLLRKKYFCKYFIFLIKSKLYNWYLYLYELKIQKKADVIVYNNSSQMKFMLRDKYLSKGVILSHSYDSTIHFNKSGSSDKITFAYAGNISKARNLDNYLKAASKIKKDSNYKNKVDFIFIGCDRKELEKFMDKHTFKYCSNLPYQECLQELNKADWLINSDANVLKGALTEYIYLPCKIIDYISFNRNILNISNFRSSPSVNITNYVGGINVNDNSEIIESEIKRIIDEKITKKEVNVDITMYSNKEIASQLDEIIRKLKE